MIFNRPTNLILGAFTALFNVVVLALAALVPPIEIPAVLVGAVNLAAGAVIALVAGTPPTLNIGDPYHIATPNGQPSIERTVSPRGDRPTDPPA